jgi:hypothetical protein
MDDDDDFLAGLAPPVSNSVQQQHQPGDQKLGQAARRLQAAPDPPLVPAEVNVKPLKTAGKGVPDVTSTLSQLLQPDTPESFSTLQRQPQQGPLQ